ncbi:MAG: amidohydrolase [Eubacteriales bacterium]|nr:amidohydrolase [Eubacteriales bacterium]
MLKKFINGKIYTGESVELEQAFAVKENVFVRVGSNDEILDYGDEEAEIIDLGGSFVCPGFNDSHMHLLNYGKALKTADLTKDTDSVASIISKVRAFIKDENIPEGAWVIGRGWNQDYFHENADYPLRWDLDKISDKHPIALTRACGHMLVVNSMALEILNIDQNTEVPYGGKIEFDKEGRPNGIFRENAMDLVTAAFPRPDKARLKELIMAAQSALNSFGITSVQTDDLLCFSNVPYEDVLSAYRELRAEGKLTVRVYEQSLFLDGKSFKKFIDKGYHTGVGDEFFKIGPLKLLGDGSLGTRTAYLDRSYNDDPSTRGMALLSEAELREMFKIASSNGMQIAVHVIGNGTLDMVLDAYEEVFGSDCARADLRNGIVHCQIMREDQLERCKRLGLHAYIQSIFLDYDIQIVDDRVGVELAKTSYNFKTMYNTMSASNGSDCPVELPFVMGGIQCAVTRKRLSAKADEVAYLPEQALSMDEALKTFSVNGAYASFEENIKGKIRGGMLADFTVLSENPFETEVGDIKNIKVLNTYVDGKMVY